MSDTDSERRSIPGSINEFVDERDCRALTETMFVRSEGPELYNVRTETGAEYVVDLREPACTCPDFRYREIECKHVRRVKLETGAAETESLAATVDDALDRVDEEIETLAARRAELVRLQLALNRFENR